MSGLLLLAGGGVWLAIVLAGLRLLGDKFPATRTRRFAQVAILLLVLPLPLMDEILGGWQFSNLCKKNTVRIERQKAKGHVVSLEIGSLTKVPGTILKVWRLPFRYLDVTTGEEIASFDQLKAEGGRLLPGSAAGHDPILFEGECHPKGSFETGFAETYGMQAAKRNN